MASNQMTGVERREITSAVEELLGRGVLFYRCPLVSRQELDDVWMSMLRPDVAAAIRTMRRAGYGLRGDVQEYSEFTWDEMGACIGFHIRNWPDPGPLYFVESPRNSRMHMQKSQHELEVLFQTFKGDGTDTHPLKLFRTWVKDSMAFHNEATRALSCFGDIMKLASTPGQVFRMVPDLVQYMTPSMKNKVGDRSSPVPVRILDSDGTVRREGWAEYDKDKVLAMCHTLAKCYLLPKPDSAIEFTNALGWNPWCSPRRSGT
jgi:hypothetical protein